MWDSHRVDILVVESNDAKRAEIVAVLEKTIPCIRVVAVRDGEEAQAFFAQSYGDVRVSDATPKLVLLDLGLPFSDSFSVIGHIRTYDKGDCCAVTPVVVFTDSQSVDDDMTDIMLLKEQLHLEGAEISSVSSFGKSRCPMLEDF